MANPKISLITVCYNASATIQDCFNSVLSQSYPYVEYIVIDGGSTDGTLKVIDKYRNRISLFVSEPDKGLYDAMNKGIALATGQIVGILNADDVFADANALAAVAEAFTNAPDDTQVVYGDIDMVNADMEPVRQWRSGNYNVQEFKWGWMPPHPAFYAQRQLFELFGGYNITYGTAADYELMLRMLHTHGAKAIYINKTLVKMRLGGVSNGTLEKRIKAWINDYKAMKVHGLPLPALSLFFKPLRKLKQYLIKL